jgi:hypothetical protein
MEQSTCNLFLGVYPFVWSGSGCWVICGKMNASPRGILLQHVLPVGIEICCSEDAYEANLGGEMLSGPRCCRHRHLSQRPHRCDCVETVHAHVSYMALSVYPTCPHTRTSCVIHRGSK